MATTDGDVPTGTDWSGYSSQSLFLDANTLVHSTIPASPFHRAARDTLDSPSCRRREASHQSPNSSRISLCHDEAAIGENAARSRSGNRNVQQFLTDFAVLGDGLPVINKLLDLLATIPCGGKQIHDANIVATMLVNGVPNQLTHNVADFQRFDKLITIIPLVP